MATQDVQQPTQTETPQTQAQNGATPAPEPTKLTVTDNRPIEIQKFEFQQRSARLFAASGLFADIKGQTVEQSIAQAFVKIALGDSMGFNPAESMTGIDIILGRVSVGSSLRAARMQRAGYSWDILQLDDKGCRLRMRYKGKPLMCEYIDEATQEVTETPTIVSFMVEDAARAGLIGKDNYKKNPRNMFFARAITNAQRWYAPGILGVDILSTEEAIDLEPEGTQDTRLAAKAASVANGIKERYAKQSNGMEAAHASADPPQGPVAASQGQPAPEVQETTEEAQARRAEIKRQEEELSQRSSKPAEVTKPNSQPEGQPLDFGEASRPQRGGKK